MSMIPIDLRPSAEAFEKIGFILGEPIDNLFRQSVFPQCWKVIDGNNHMWKYVVDETGRKRAVIFHKNDFWDENSHAYVIDE